MTPAEQAAVLAQGIKDFLSGDYDNPRSHRPIGFCRHGRYHYEECDLCDAGHFTRVLAAAGIVP